jgi:hypothetical protein
MARVKMRESSEILLLTPIHKSGVAAAVHVEYHY